MLVNNFNAKNLEKIIQQYPKSRTILPDKQKNIYHKEYKLNREGQTLTSSISQKLESWMHRRLSHSSSGRTLELGAGTLNHLEYEIRQGSLESYEIVEPMKILYRDKPELISLLSSRYEDISEVSFSQRFNRIISVATLEHITNLPEVIARSVLLLKNEGVFHHGIPSEGGFLWGLSWRCSTGLSYKLRTGEDYQNIMEHEHVNNFNEIVTLVSHFFEYVEIHFFPLQDRHLSLYSEIFAKGPKKKKAISFLYGNHDFEINR